MSPHKATISPETVLMAAQLLKQLGDFPEGTQPNLGISILNMQLNDAFSFDINAASKEPFLYQQCNEAKKK